MWPSTSNGISKTSKEHLKKNPLSIGSTALIHSNEKALQKERISLVVHVRQVGSQSLPSLARVMSLVFLGLGATSLPLQVCPVPFHHQLGTGLVGMILMPLGPYRSQQLCHWAFGEHQTPWMLLSGKQVCFFFFFCPQWYFVHLEGSFWLRDIDE